MLIEWLIQFGPISVFFITFEATGRDFFAATAALMIAVVIATGASLIHDHRLPWFPIFSAAFTLSFGGATLYFRDPNFLIIKETLYDALFGFGLLFGLAFKKNMLKVFFMPLFALKEHGWQVLAVRWALFFIISAAMNEIMRQTLTPEIWVRYKIANTLALIAFGLFQLRLTGKERLVRESNILGMRIFK